MIPLENGALPDYIFLFLNHFTETTVSLTSDPELQQPTSKRTEVTQAHDTMFNVQFLHL